MRRSPFKDKKLRLSRRDFLNVTGLGTFGAAVSNPLMGLLGGLANGLIRKAQAAEGVAPSVNYVHIQLNMAPTELVWSLPLRPHNNMPNLVLNLGVGSGFSGGNPSAYDNCTYVTVPISSGGQIYRLPPLWNAQIPTSSGGWVPARSLLDSMLMIRGVNKSIDGHAINQHKNDFPGGSSSLSALVADRTLAKALPAVATAGTYADSFKSVRGTGIVRATGTWDPLGEVLRSFDQARSSGGVSPATSFWNRRSTLSAALEDVMSALGEFSGGDNPGARALAQVAKNAETEFPMNLAAIRGEWQEARNRYQDLILRCARQFDPNFSSVDFPKIAHLTDKVVPRHNTYGSLMAVDRHLRCRMWPTNSRGEGLPDTEEANFEPLWIGNPDLRTVINGSSLSDFSYPSLMAENFATAEVLLKRGLSSSIMLGVSNVQGLRFYESGPAALNENNSTFTPAAERSGNPSSAEAIAANRIAEGRGYMFFDMHNTGRAASVMICGFLYHCMNACLFEFINRIGTQTWANTVVNITGEFSRNPRHSWSSLPTHPDFLGWHWRQIQGPDGSGGSDHAWWGSGMTLLTGQVGSTGLCVVGNVDPDPLESLWGPAMGAFRWNYGGTWGAAGMLNIDGSFHLANMGNLTSTVAALLNVEAPLPNFGPMATVSGGRFQAQTECLNVANAPRNNPGGRTSIKVPVEEI